MSLEIMLLPILISKYTFTPTMSCRNKNNLFYSGNVITAVLHGCLPRRLGTCDTSQSIITTTIVTLTEHTFLSDMTFTSQRLK